MEHETRDVKESAGRFERWLFGLRWPIWGLLAVVVLRSSRLDLEPAFLLATLSIAAGLNVLLFALQFLPTLSAAARLPFLWIDFAVLATLMVKSAMWPTPLYPFFFFPIAILALGIGWGAGAAAGAVFATAGAFFYFPQRVMSFSPFSSLEEGVMLGCLPFLGCIIGALNTLVESAERQRLRLQVQELLQTRDRLDAVYAMASTLGATLNYYQVLQTLFEVSSIEFRALGVNPSTLVGMALLFDETPAEPSLHVVAGRGISEEDKSVGCPAREGVLAQALRSEEPMVVQEPASDPELSRLPSLAKTHSAVLVPLRAGFEAYGVILFASPRRDAFDPNRCFFLEAFSNQATIALQNARLFQTLQEEKDRIITQQEEIRRELARELHDGPTQVIAALAMRLNYARSLVKRKPDAAIEELEELEDLARQTTKQIRTMLFTLRPVILETQGLPAAVRHYGEKLKETEGLIVEVDDSRLSAPIPDEIAGVVFSILEEAINNARKHAQAHRVMVRLRNDQTTFVAEVEDDGIGFDVQSVLSAYDRRESLGLINMRERAELLEGTLTIHSGPGQGTRVILAAPLQRLRRRSPGGASAAPGS